ncbi:virion structural protein [Synechococcus phage S-CBWM1]|uniref:Virion structural protein n=1 Tax=Synechococcus phage S-CBWM1 TaxID=2053653 RepID=A0A3G1L3U7_9CAUD|nr:virion structural protein [Synechococcus phage S-CBWM1]ATW62858.1 virion structural protein [Synechococcus phage S-CBWM1]
MNTWLNFRDSRNLSATDARVERQAESVGANKYSPGRIKAANDGARERGTLGGGAADKCVKGKSCNAACIHRNKDCLVGLPESSSAALTKMSQHLSSRLGAGAISDEDAEKVIDALKGDEKALKKFGELVTSGKASESDLTGVASALVSINLAPNQDRNASRTMPFDELEDIQKRGLGHFEEASNKSIGEDGVFNPRLPGGMGDLVRKKFLINEISDEAAEAAYAMLPTSVKTALNNAGAVADGKAFAGYDSSGEPIFGSPSKVRGVFLLKRWMEQGGLDPYTGRPIDIRRAEPEHLFSFSEAGKTGVSGDQPENLLWSDPKPNNLKKDYTFPKFKSIVDGALSLGREKYNSEVYEPSLRSASATKDAKSQAPKALAAAIEGTNPKERADSIKKLVDTYGETGNSPLVRYLFRAADLTWQFNERDPEQRRGGRPSNVNRNVPSLPTLKTKPSKAILTALAVASPEKRQELKERLNSLVKARTLTDSEVELIRKDPSLRSEFQSARNEKYAEDLEKVLSEAIPGLSGYLG